MKIKFDDDCQKSIANEGLTVEENEKWLMGNIILLIYFFEIIYSSYPVIVTPELLKKVPITE